jgi:hypothetical protein
MHVLLKIRSESSHKILHDNGNKVRGEYWKNARECEFFEKWYKEMETGYKISYSPATLNKRIADSLHEMKFTGEVDRILVALALKTGNDKYIITEDSDFGKGDTEKAEQHADVRHYLTNQLQLTVHDAEEALRFYDRVDRE